MTRMWRREQSKADWLQRAPRWTTAMLAGVLAAQAVHVVLHLRYVAMSDRPPSVPAPTRLTPLDAAPIVSAHLFGGAPTVPVAADASGAPDTHLPLEVSGIIAMRDPAQGYAILGEHGQRTHTYGVGAAVSGGHLYRVFSDRVVLDLGAGRLETLRLPRTLLATLIAPPRGIAVANNVDKDASAPAAPAGAEPEGQVTLAESTFGGVNAEPANVDGQMVGMTLHPQKRMQRLYGVREGDLLTAVNGVQVSDADALAATLKNEQKSLTLTVVRDGVTQTKTVPVTN